ncbi:unnamed protein product, partial [Phaeothamnion confervicola]
QHGCNHHAAPPWLCRGRVSQKRVVSASVHLSDRTIVMILLAGIGDAMRDKTALLPAILNGRGKKAHR